MALYLALFSFLTRLSSLETGSKVLKLCLIVSYQSKHLKWGLIMVSILRKNWTQLSSKCPTLRRKKKNFPILQDKSLQSKLNITFHHKNKSSMMMKSCILLPSILNLNLPSSLKIFQLYSHRNGWEEGFSKKKPVYSRTQSKKQNVWS